MGYIQDLEKDLKEILNDETTDAEEWGQRIIKFVKEKIIESYKNGLMAAKFVKAGKEAERETRKFSRRQ